MRKLGPVVAMLVLPLLSPPASATPFPSSVPLPDDFQPEGIAIGPGDTFYVGSLRDGDIYRGDLSTGEGSVFVDVSGRVSVGMEADVGHGRLWVAGGADGRGWVYDLRTGATLAELQLAPASPPGFPTVLVNDVTVTETAAYFTDTFGPHVFKVPIGADGSIGTPATITVTGPAGATGDFGLNGIKATPDGSTLIVNHTAAGILATVDTETGESRAIDLGGDSLIPGTADGLILEGHTAWVVENFAETLVEVRLSPDWTSGRLVSRTTDPLFRVPTTVAAHGSRLALVNGRFDLGFPPPFDVGAPPGTDFDVVVVRKP
jgi:sugar lactone lactonase YvrE